MSETRKRPSLGDFIVETRHALRDLIVVQPRLWWSQTRERLRDLPKSNFTLGQQFAAQGLWFDAIFRFRMTLYLKADYPGAWYYLGCCYLRSGKPGLAVDALKRAVSADPSDEAAWFALASVAPEAVPAHQRSTRMPTSMVMDYFTAAAERYEAEAAAQRYNPACVAEAVLPLLKEPAPLVVDLACGTGLAAHPWRSKARRMVGVEMVPAMAALARQALWDNRPLFDQVVEADMLALPAGAVPVAEADLVQLVDTAPLLGDLAPVFAASAAMLRRGGLLALVVDVADVATEDYVLDAQRWRYAHALPALHRWAEQAGLQWTQEVRVALYPDAPSTLLILTKG